MPNWCNNDLQITNLKTEEIETIKTKYLNTDKDVEPAFDFEKILPTPQGLMDMQAPNRGSAETAKLLVRAYGDTDWYNWRVKNWGTKWNVNPDSGNLGFGENEISYSFDTAWGPACELIEYMSTLFPEATFMLEYAEPGCGLAGRRTFVNGELTDENDDEDGSIMMALNGEDEWEEAEDENGPIDEF